MIVAQTSIKLKKIMFNRTKVLKFIKSSWDTRYFYVTNVVPFGTLLSLFVFWQRKLDKFKYLLICKKLKTCCIDPGGVTLNGVITFTVLHHLVSIDKFNGP